MKNILISFLFFSLSYQEIKAQFYDLFSDSEIGNSPSWTGDTAYWKVENGVLRSEGPAISGSHIGLYTTVGYAPEREWRIFVNLKMATSSNNYLDWILAADSIRPGGSFKGYFIRVGGSSDDISLFRKDGTAVTRIFDGPDAMLASSSSNPLSLRVTSDSSGNYFIYFRRDTASGIFDSLGFAMDVTYRGGTFTGLEATYSSANFNKFYADNVYYGPVWKDTTKPVLLSAKTLNPLKVRLNFSEKILVKKLALTVMDMKGKELVPSIVQDSFADGSINLLFPDSFHSGSVYEVIISSYADMTGNYGVPLTKTFSYYIPKQGDIIFTEIMPDPTPVKGLPETEYIEIKNQSPFPVSLENWTIKDASNQALFPDITLSSGAHLVIYAQGSTPPCDSNSLALAIPSTLLNNSGDELHLLDAGGLVADQLFYSDKWYGPVTPAGGYSLERKFTGIFCHPTAENWTVSTSPAGGTPGYVNSADVATGDHDTLVVESIRAEDATHLSVIFNRHIHPLMQEETFYTYNGVNPSEATVSSDTLYLTFTAGFKPDPLEWKHLVIDTTYDCAGNSYTGSNDSFRFCNPVIPRYKQLIFNEIMLKPDPARALFSSQYIEIGNRSLEAVSFLGSVIIFKGTEYQLPDYVLFPGELVLITPQQATGAYGKVNVAGMSRFPPLTFSSGELILANGQGETIDVLPYDQSWYQDEVKARGGWSLERKDTLFVCQDSYSWSASDDQRGGSPGEVNELKKVEIPTEAPWMQRSYTLDSSALLVFFSEPMTEELKQRDNWFLEGENRIRQARPANVHYTEWRVDLQEPMQAGKVYLLSVNASSCYGVSLEKPASVKAGIPGSDTTWAINEVLFNPYSGGTDFVEIINYGNSVIDLKNCWLTSENGGQANNPVNISERGFLMFPGDLVVLKRKGEDISGYANVSREHVIELEDFPPFPDEAGVVILKDSSAQTRDRLAYHENWHFGMISVTDGVSLERIDPLSATQNPYNWASAASGVGYATPTRKNSQYLLHDKSAAPFSLTSNTFSPDGDGYEDLALIRFNSTQNGQTMRIRVFNEQGILLRELVNNSYMETSGLVSWDGTGTEGNVCSPGVYLFWIETFTQHGARKVYKLPVVLARRL